MTLEQALVASLHEATDRKVYSTDCLRAAPATDDTIWIHIERNDGLLNSYLVPLSVFKRHLTSADGYRKQQMKSIGQWRLWNHDDTDYVFVKCPGCGQEYRLDHDISVQGVVSPSLECPGDECTFHDTVILAGWPGPAVTSSHV